MASLALSSCAADLAASGPAVEGDRQLLTALRHIQRYPVRAKLVPRVRNWPWSSVGERLGGLLAPLPDDWPAWLDHSETPAEIAAAPGEIYARRGG